MCSWTPKISDDENGRERPARSRHRVIDRHHAAADGNAARAGGQAVGVGGDLVLAQTGPAARRTRRRRSRGDKRTAAQVRLGHQAENILAHDDAFSCRLMQTVQSTTAADGSPEATELRRAAVSTQGLRSSGWRRGAGTPTGDTARAVAAARSSAATTRWVPEPPPGERTQDSWRRRAWRASTSAARRCRFDRVGRLVDQPGDGAQHDQSAVSVTARPPCQRLTSPAAAAAPRAAFRPRRQRDPGRAPVIEGEIEQHQFAQRAWRSDAPPIGRRSASRPRRWLMGPSSPALRTHGILAATMAAARSAGRIPSITTRAGTGSAANSGAGGGASIVIVKPRPLLRPSWPAATRSLGAAGREARIAPEALEHRAGDGEVHVVADQVQLEGPCEAAHVAQDRVHRRPAAPSSKGQRSA